MVAINQVLFRLALIFAVVQGCKSLFVQEDSRNENVTFQREVAPECELQLARVVGGDLLNQVERFPYLVAIQKWEEDLGVYMHYCGGVLISSNLVVTAAHCIYLKSTNVGGSSDFRTDRFNEGPFQSKDVVVALSPLCRHQSGLGRVKIDRYYLPREYNGRPTNPDGYDIAILVLENQLPYDGPFLDYKSSADMIMEQVPMLVLLGYGGVSAGERSNRILYASRVTPLKVGPLSYLDPQVCNEIVEEEDSEYKINEKRVVCAFNENVDACFGDSGGPLIYADGAGQLDIQNGSPEKDVFVGLVSWGPDWACTSITGFPGIYTKISSYIGWIESVIQREESSVFQYRQGAKNGRSNNPNNTISQQVDQTINIP